MLFVKLKKKKKKKEEINITSKSMCAFELASLLKACKIIVVLTK